MEIAVPEGCKPTRLTLEAETEERLYEIAREYEVLVSEPGIESDFTSKDEDGQPRKYRQHRLYVTRDELDLYIVGPKRYVKVTIEDV